VIFSSNAGKISKTRKAGIAGIAGIEGGRNRWGKGVRVNKLL